jgi:hypothetical protein
MENIAGVPLYKWIQGEGDKNKTRCYMGKRCRMENTVFLGLKI